MTAYGIPWYGWLLIASCLIKPLLMPFFVGKKREPYTPTDCFVSWLLTALYVWALVELAT